MPAFNDLQRIEIYDVEHSINEDRYNTIGMVHDVLFVVYTERKENIRLISARLATRTCPCHGKSISSGGEKPQYTKKNKYIITVTISCLTKAV